MSANNLETLLSGIKNTTDISGEAKERIFQTALRCRDCELNVMITGATGSGKSSTINAILGDRKAEVGIGADPMTMEITRYALDNFVLWDTTGFGDGRDADERHARNIIQKLFEVDSDGNFLIDLVLVITDGGSRDLGTLSQMLNNVIVPCLGDAESSRILLALNKADVAMGGYHWNRKTNEPKDYEMREFLRDKIESVKRRIAEDTGLYVNPFFYSAGYSDEDEPQRPYNISGLLYYIFNSVPQQKRAPVVERTVSSSSSSSSSSYDPDPIEAFGETFADCAEGGCELGGVIGSILGEPGEFVGNVVGGVAGMAVGTVAGTVRGVFNFIDSFFD